MFGACVYLFQTMNISWWWFMGCILLPDVGMLGYLLNIKTGAYTYNFFHHKAVALIVGFSGILTGHEILQFSGLILFAHASLDRMLGYGLKYKTGFPFTHLGLVGNENHHLNRNAS